MLTACITTTPLSQEQRPTHWGKLIHTPHNFYQISPFVFRSEQPSRTLVPLLTSHNIDMVINLRTSNKDQEELKDTPFQLIHIPIQTWAISRQDLLEVMQAIQQAQQHQQNILIHCYHGSDRTGASIAMYRIIFENWSTQDALDEMKRGGYGFHPIWFNIEKLFTTENIRWIRQQLSNPSINREPN